MIEQDDRPLPRLTGLRIRHELCQRGPSIATYFKLGKKIFANYLSGDAVNELKEAASAELASERLVLPRRAPLASGRLVLQRSPVRLGGLLQRNSSAELAPHGEDGDERDAPQS